MGGRLWPPPGGGCSSAAGARGPLGIPPCLTASCSKIGAAGCAFGGPQYACVKSTAPSLHYRKGPGKVSTVGCTIAPVKPTTATCSDNKVRRSIMAERIARMATTAAVQVRDTYVQFTKESIESAANKLNGKRALPFIVQHDPSCMPLGKVTDAWIEPFGQEHSLMARFYIESAQAASHVPSSTKLVYLSFQNAPKPFILECKPTEDNSLTVVGVDRANFKDTSSRDAFLDAVADIDSHFAFTEVGRHSLVPEPLIEFLLSDELALAIGLWVLRRAELFLRHTIDETLKKVGNTISDDLSTKIKKTLQAYNHHRDADSRPITIKVLIRNDPNLVLLSRVSPAEDFSCMNLDNLATELKKYRDILLHAEEVTLLRTGPDGWKFQYLKTRKGEILGTGECYSRTLERLREVNAEVPGRRVRPRRGPRGRAGATLGSPPRVAGTTSEDLRSEGYTDRGRGTYSPRPRRATSRLSFCARPKRLSSARKPPSSLRPSSVGASSSAWRRTRSPRPGWPQPPAAARRSGGWLRRSGGLQHLAVVQCLDLRLQGSISLAAFFLRSAQEAVIRSDDRRFSSLRPCIGRRFLVGVGVGRSGLRDRAFRSRRPPRGGFAEPLASPERRSASVQHLVDVVQCLVIASACRRSISLSRSAIAFAMTLIGFFPGGVYRPSLDAFWGSGPSAFQWVRILAQREFSGQTEPASARRRRIPRERVQPRRSLVRRPQQPAAGSATPHPNSASESTNRTKSACREMDCFS